jgi:hypothetical protein
MAIASWFFIPFVFMEVLVKIPGTHIYNYLLPLFVILGVGAAFISRSDNLLKFRSSKIIVNAFLTILGVVIFGFLSYQSYMIFVDNVKEYPWEDEKLFNLTMEVPDRKYALSLFGFPYYRDWKSIGFFVRNVPGETAYFTNEKTSISKFYVPLTKSSTTAGFYVYIHNPQSFDENITDERAAYWVKNHPPVYTLSKYGTDFVRIYILPHMNKAQMISEGY